MTTRDPRMIRFLFVLLLVLSLSAVFSSSAQSTSLTQISKTLDGQISIRLPDGWQARDAAATTFTSTLAFGDSAESLQSVIDSLRGAATTGGVRMNGVIGIINPQLLASLPTDLAMSTMLNSMIASSQQAGGQVLEQQSIMMGDGAYPASIAVISQGQAKGFVGVFQAGAEIVEFTMGAAPERNFDANRQMFIDMLNSIRVPAETGSSLPATPALAQPIPVQPSGDQAVTSSKSGVFSVRLPSGWISSPSSSVPNFGDVILFGSDQAALQAGFNVIVSGQHLGTFQGVSGMIGVVAPAQIANAQLDSLVAPLMQSLVGFATTAGAQSLSQPAAHTYGGQYSGELEALNVGYIAVMHSDKQLLVAFILSSDVTADKDVLSGLLESIRMPAESANAPQPVATTAPAEPQTVRSSDSRLSLEMPGNWVVLDHVADQNILAYGDSDTAAQSRLYSAKPDLAAKTAISGNGGLVILYPMAQLGIDPAKPDLSGLMERALSNLQGYSVEQAAAPLEGSSGGLIALISGTEHGYLALIPFGDQVAYVTATGTQSTFAANQSSLLEIVKSVHVPAVSEGTGLGGLGGLEAATPEVTPSGLGGL